MTDAMIVQPNEFTENIGNTILMDHHTNKDEISRLKRYITYLDDHGLQWWRNVDLLAYRDDLFRAGLAPSSVTAHLSTIRAAYRRLVRNRKLIHTVVNRTMGFGETLGPSDLHALAQEIIGQIEGAIHPDSAPTQQHIVQDRTDRQQVRLTISEIRSLIEQPADMYGEDSPVALRDSAIMAFLATTGLREQELVNLKVGDLRQYADGELCVLVRRGKGNKQRMVPYGELMLGLQRTERWLNWLRGEMDVSDDTPVFWSFWKNNSTLRGPLSVRSIHALLSNYRIKRDSGYITPAPHDYRRTYARLQYDAGLPILAISQNMGHSSIEMTKKYIGNVDMRTRRNRNVFN